MQAILHDWAALYVAGAMTSSERTQFDLLLECHEELQAHVARLQEATVSALMRGVPQVTPPVVLKNRILDALEAIAPAVSVGTGEVAKVRTNAAGLIEWVNPAFTTMCGYTLDELRGKKPGALLQGAQTAADAVAQVRAALREARPIETELMNYHKDGSPYRVLVAITPILNDERQPIFFVASERKLALVA